MRRITLGLSAFLFAVTGVVMGASGARATNDESNVPGWAWNKTWERCEYEDSHNCVWNAKRDGLGGGTSYIATSKKRIIHIEHYEAYRLTHHFIRLIYAP